MRLNSTLHFRPRHCEPPFSGPSRTVEPFPLLQYSAAVVTLVDEVDELKVPIKIPEKKGGIENDHTKREVLTIFFASLCHKCNYFMTILAGLGALEEFKATHGQAT